MKSCQTWVVSGRENQYALLGLGSGLSDLVVHQRLTQIAPVRFAADQVEVCGEADDTHY